MATTKLWTIDEVAQLPDDDHRYALIRGELYRMPPPQARHGRIVATLIWYVFGFVRSNSLGQVYDQSGFILERDPDTLIGPDLSFVRSTHVPADPDGYPELPPDLVVEVVSPSHTGPSIAEKVAIYREAGVRLIWIVDPKRRTVQIHRSDGTEVLLTEDEALEGEDVLPGFRLPVAAIFA
jgi:Uma2 family endonuclease